jgi:hypothetical protein
MTLVNNELGEKKIGRSRGSEYEENYRLEYEVV